MDMEKIRDKEQKEEVEITDKMEEKEVLVREEASREKKDVNSNYKV